MCVCQCVFLRKYSFRISIILCRYGYSKVLAALIDAKADISIPNKEGDSL